MMLSPQARDPERRAETCVVLAGGAGRRLGRITHGANKHLVPVGAVPALRHVLETVVATPSVQRLVVVTRPDSRGDVEAIVLRARERLDVVVRVQARPIGTLDAVLVAEPAIAHASFSVHYGDNLFAWRRLPALDLALPRGATACLYTVPPPADWRRFASVRAERDRDGELRATELEEKPTGPPRFDARALTGFFRFDTRAFRGHAPLVSPSPRGELELTDVVRAMVAHEAVRVMPVGTPWVDYGTEPGLLEAAAVIDARGDWHG